RFADSVSGRAWLGAVHRRLLGLFPALDGRAETEAALAEPGRPLGSLSRDLVPGRRRYHAVLPLEDESRGRGPPEAGLDRAGPVRAQRRSLSSSYYDSPWRQRPDSSGRSLSARF